MKSVRRSRCAAVALVVLLTVGCRNSDDAPAPRVEPSAPVASPTCAIDSPGIEAPLRVAGECIDARVDVRRFGRASPERLDVACERYFEDDCESLHRSGAESVLAVEYVPITKGTHRLRVVVVDFARQRGAFAAFSERVVGDASPASSEYEAFDVPGAAALGEGHAWIWRGRRLVEVIYTSDVETPEEKKRRSGPLLRVFSREFAENLGGDVSLPSESAWFDGARLLPFGLRLRDDGFLGVTGSGPHVLAAMNDSGGRHERVVVVRSDETSAKEWMSLLGRECHGKWLRNKTVLAVRWTREGHPPQSWYLERVGRVLVGVGPLPDEAAESSSFERAAFERLSDLRRRVTAAPPERG